MPRTDDRRAIDAWSASGRGASSAPRVDEPEPSRRAIAHAGGLRAAWPDCRSASRRRYPAAWASSDCCSRRSGSTASPRTWCRAARARSASASRSARSAAVSSRMVLRQGMMLTLDGRGHRSRARRRRRAGCSDRCCFGVGATDPITFAGSALLFCRHRPGRMLRARPPRDRDRRDGGARARVWSGRSGGCGQVGWVRWGAQAWAERPRPYWPRCAQSGDCRVDRRARAWRHRLLRNRQPTPQPPAAWTGERFRLGAPIAGVNATPSFYTGSRALRGARRRAAHISRLLQGPRSPKAYRDFGFGVRSQPLIEIWQGQIRRRTGWRPGGESVRRHGPPRKSAPMTFRVPAWPTTPLAAAARARPARRQNGIIVSMRCDRRSRSKAESDARRMLGVPHARAARRHRSALARRAT